MTVLIFFTGYLAGLLGTWLGSGGFISFPILLLLGVPPHTLIAANKFSGFISLFTSFLSANRKVKLSYRFLLWTALFSLVGGAIGGWLATLMTESMIVWMALIILTGALLFSFIKPISLAWIQNRSCFATIGIMAIYNGMLGPGQASIVMQSLLSRGSGYLKAIGITRFHTCISGLSALIVFIQAGFMEWSVGLPLCAGAILGGQTAVFTANKLPQHLIRPAIKAILLIVITILAVRQIGGFSL